MQRVLITGAAGSIGSRMRRLLAGRYPVMRLSDTGPLGPAGPGEEVDQTDLANPDACLTMCDGVDGILHFGGISGEAPWPDITRNNIQGQINLFEAARRQGVQRMMIATSNHAVGFYRRDQRIPHDVTPLPDSRYGVSKAFGELLGALYAHRYGMRVLCVRIGNVTDEPVDRRRLSIWISPRDMSQMCRIAMEHPDLRFEIVYGVSNNSRSFYDNANAFRLGYAPEDSSDDFAEDVLAREPELDPTDPAEIHQGGSFVHDPDEQASS